MNYLAKNIRLLRKNGSKTQEGIGLLVDKGQTTIGNWENGKSEPNIEELLIISNFFDISIDLLLKVDLARTNYLYPDLTKEEDLPPSKENTVKYSHNEWESLVNEYDERILSHILLEVRSLRQEFNQSRTDRKTNPINDPINERKPGRKTGKKTDLKKKSPPVSGHPKPITGSSSSKPHSGSRRKTD